MNVKEEFMNFLNKLERKYGRFSIPNLMLFIIMGNIIVYIAQFLLGLPIIEWIYFDPAYIMQGQIWRIISWIFIPISSSPIWFIFAILLYYSIGRELEYQWGTFKFNVYYLLGIIFNIIAFFISGGNMIITATYMNLSLFLAYAVLFPDVQFALYGIIPIKVKYLAALDIAFLLVNLIRGTTSTRILIIVSLLNFLLFFGSTLMRGRRTSTQKQFKKHKRELKQGAPIKVAFHKCAVCGKTELTDPEAEFRYCSSCNGNYEYCMEHLHNHEHKQ